MASDDGSGVSNDNKLVQASVQEGPLIRDASRRRDLVDVIEDILGRVPRENFALRGSLEDLLAKASHVAPELRWNVLGDTFLSYFDGLAREAIRANPGNEPWVSRVVAIATGDDEALVRMDALDGSRVEEGPSVPPPPHYRFSGVTGEFASTSAGGPILPLIITSDEAAMRTRDPRR
jgi:hypothetical protein